jgi:ribosomal protein S13
MGFNTFLSNQICDQLGFHVGLTIGNLSLDQIEKLSRILQYYYLTEGDLKKTTSRQLSTIYSNWLL